MHGPASPDVGDTGCMDTEYVVAMTTVDTEEAADRLATVAVEARHAACAQVLPIRSVYRWEGRVEQGEERLLLFKTTAAAVGELEAALAAHHPYDVPEFVVVPVTTGSPDYLAWIAGSVR